MLQAGSSVPVLKLIWEHVCWHLQGTQSGSGCVSHGSNPVDMSMAFTAIPMCMCRRRIRCTTCHTRGDRSLVELVSKANSTPNIARNAESLASLLRWLLTVLMALLHETHGKQECSIAH